MSNKNNVQQLWRLFSEQNWDESKKLFHPEFTAYWPQSKERFANAENFIEMNRAYPGNHTAKIRQLVEEDNTISCTAFISADTGQTAFGTSYFEFKDGLIFKATEYWGDEYEAPESRKKWTCK